MSALLVVCPSCSKSRKVGQWTAAAIRSGRRSGRCRDCAGSGKGGVRHVLSVLTAEYESNGQWPVHARRLMALCGYRSPSTVHKHLRELLRVGLVEKGPSDGDGWRPA